MPLFTFWAGFFREGHVESSTRLVGIGSFAAGIFLAVYMVMTGKTDANEQVVLGQCFTFGCIALGLRKTPDTKSLLVPRDGGPTVAVIADKRPEVVSVGTTDGPGTTQPPTGGG